MAKTSCRQASAERAASVRMKSSFDIGYGAQDDAHLNGLAGSIREEHVGFELRAARWHLAHHRIFVIVVQDST